MVKEIRQLAAIMFADIVGFTAMMQENEERARELRKRHRTVIDAALADHAGLAMETYGDGTLIVFSSAIDAVRCAIAVQNDLRAAPAVPLRIGVHMGDIVYDDDGIYGDCVNIASRIESLAVAGSVLISEKVQDELRNHPDLKAASLGEFLLKNVSQPMHLFAMQNDTLTVPPAETLHSDKASRIHSVAVLPFVNMSGDQENEYFSDGITEEIINALVRVNGLRVTSRTSSFAFKGKNHDVREIGRQLGVSTVLEGSVRKAGNRVRVTAQLINSSDGYHIFSESYDRDLKDIFAVQDDIAGSITVKLRASIDGPSRPGTSAARANVPLDAYNLFLKALYHWRKWTPSAVKLAIQLAEQSVEIAPDFARGFAALSSAYIYLGAIGYMPTAAAYPKSREYAQRALALDDRLGEAHLAIGGVQMFYDWDWTGARASFDRGLELSPNSADAHDLLALYHCIRNEPEEALRLARIAVELDPLAMNTHRTFNMALVTAHRYEEALEECDRMLELEPGSPTVDETRGWLYTWMGDLDRAIEHFSTYQSKLDSELKGRTGLGYVYGLSGRLEEARACIEATEERARRYPELDLDIDLAILYAGINDLEHVFELLYSAEKKRMGGLLFMGSHPGWGLLAADPRFGALMNRIGLSIKIPPSASSDPG